VVVFVRGFNDSESLSSPSLLLLSSLLLFFVLKSSTPKEVGDGTETKSCAERAIGGPSDVGQTVTVSRDGWKSERRISSEDELKTN